MNGSTRRKTLVAPKQHLKENKSTATPKEFALCPRCKGYSSDYAKSINYINSCHDIINRMMLQAEFKASFAMPVLPNFLNILASLHADSKQGELDNVETLDELISSLDYADSEIVSSSDDGDKKEKLHQQQQQQQQNAKSSNIPRPVCLERGGLSQVKTPQHTVSNVTIEKVDSTQSARMNRVLVDVGFCTSEDCMQEWVEVETQADSLLQQNEDKYSVEMVQSSCSVTPQSSPRDVGIQIYSSKRNQRNPSYKTKSENNLKVASKNKNKSGRILKKRAMEEQSESLPLPPPPPPHARPKSPIERQFEKKMSQRKSQSQPSIREETNEQVLIENDKLFPNNYEDSDIEPDDQQQLSLLKIRNSLVVNKHQRREATVTIRNGTSISQPDAHYVVKQKPIDFFTRRRPNGRDELSDSDHLETERNVKELESDIDDDAFGAGCPIKSAVEDAFIKNRPSLSRMSVRASNMDLIAQLGKVKPEKDNDLRHDARNVPFRQPRTFMEEEDETEYTNKTLPCRGAISSHSSDIKTDDEELICTHQMDVCRINH